MPETPLTPFIGDRVPRILVVDDNPANLAVLAAHLRRWRCAVTTASTGPEALAAARAAPPDLVLLDILMPDVSGLEVCEALQADPAMARIPVIFVTALTDVDSKVRAFDAGARDYITKPFDAAELAARVGTRLRQKYAEDELQRRTGGAGRGTPPAPGAGAVGPGTPPVPGPGRSDR
ncbi:MAG: response regulator [Armatimonadota bacterium]|nr:response regulator [Armatimonadota bacterium]MDR7485073.1 response regulator [Armatimonadota bacterium]MDR7537038.1 response regulator [Armatimonadota bacterium]